MMFPLLRRTIIRRRLSNPKTNTITARLSMNRVITWNNPITHSSNSMWPNRIHPPIRLRRHRNSPAARGMATTKMDIEVVRISSEAPR